MNQLFVGKIMGCFFSKGKSALRKRPPTRNYTTLNTNKLRVRKLILLLSEYRSRYIFIFSQIVHF